MKTVILALAATLFIGQSTFAKGNHPKPVYETINKAMSYPTNIGGSIQNDFALVEFTIDKKGNIEVLGTNASNEALIKHVKTELGKITFDSNQYQPGEKYIYKFKFAN